MFAVQFDDVGKASYAEVPDPLIASNEVLVRPIASGICHTDLEILHGRYGASRFPLIPGHEYAGEIVEVGAEVTDFRTGDRVVVDPNVSCGNCRYCERGRFNLCENLQAYGVTSDGGFAELNAISPKNIVPIGDMPYSRAALAEPLGCVLNGLDAIAHVGAKNAVIFGAGPIGVLLGLALRSRSGVEVTMVDREASRLEFAADFGFQAALSTSQELSRAERSFDLAIDATGVSAVAQGLPKLVANGGGVLLFGVCPPQETIAVFPFEVFRRQLTIAGSHSLNHNIPEAIELIGQIGPQIDKLVSHRLPLADIPAAMSGALGKGTLKIQADITL